MRFAVTLMVLGALEIAAGLAQGGWGWLLVWSGVSFCAVGAAYLVRRPELLGKRQDGTLRPSYIALLLPYFALTWSLWHFQRWLAREACCHEVAPGIWLGRRPFANEVPPGVSAVIDLTAEFSEPKAVRTGRAYVCCPTLDGTAPSDQAIRQAVALGRDPCQKLYVHCALGHGRSATVVAAILLARGICPTPADAEEFIRRARPGARLHAEQRRLLGRMRDLDAQ